MKLGILTSHPIQYQAPLFREIAGRRGASLRVFFCHDHGVRPTFDPGFGKVIAFDVPLLDGYDHEFMPSVSPRPRRQLDTSAKFGSFTKSRARAARAQALRFDPYPQPRPVLFEE